MKKFSPFFFLVLFSISVTAQFKSQEASISDENTTNKKSTSRYVIQNDANKDFAVLSISKINSIKSKQHNSMNTNLVEPHEAQSDAKLQATNFNITVVDETCSTSNNGIISVSGADNFDYTANLKGFNVNEFKNFTNFARFENLPAGSYELCLTIDGEPLYKECFTLQVSKPKQLEVAGNLDPSGKLISLNLKGGATYIINLNGTTYTTSDSKINIPLSRAENQLSVKTAIDCQGTHEETIMTSYSAISIYPNPVMKGDVAVQLTNGFSGSVRIALFSEAGKMVLHDLRDFKNGTLTLNIDNLPSGIYSLQINTEAQTYTRRIIKKDSE